LTFMGLSSTIASVLLSLSVNIDHVGTLRQARMESIPDPVHAAALVELGGADGVTVHLRQDRRHINDRDVDLLRGTVKTELTVEMAVTDDLLRFVTRIRPSQVTIVPEVRAEVTTTRGLSLSRDSQRLRAAARRLSRAGIRVSMFVEPDPTQMQTARALGADVVELNTDRYSKGWLHRPGLLDELARASAAARDAGLIVHVGHGLDYRNVIPVLERKITEGFSIGFAIVARAVFVGLRDAVAEMKRIMEVYT